jgi:hypothetical protein
MLLQNELFEFMLMKFEMKGLKIRWHRRWRRMPHDIDGRSQVNQRIPGLGFAPVLVMEAAYESVTGLVILVEEKKIVHMSTGNEEAFAGTFPENRSVVLVYMEPEGDHGTHQGGMPKLRGLL